MFTCSKRLLAVLILIVAPALYADVPASQPAGSPTDAFRAFLLDVQQGNSTDISSLCSAHQPESRQLQKDFQSVATAMGELRKSVTDKFGADSVDSVLPPLPSMGDLDDVTETITGDRAQVGGGNVWPMQLVRDQGHWKLDLDWFTGSDDMPQNPHWFADMAAAIHHTARDIATGRLTTVSAATEAMLAREQAIPDTAPATQPTTQSTTQP